MPLILRTVSGKKGKGREFDVHLHCMMAVEPHPAADDTFKPCWLSFCGTPAECSPVAANLKLGCKAVVMENSCTVARLNIGKTDSWRTDVQDLPGEGLSVGGQSVTLAAPDLFDLNATGARGDRSRFVFLAPSWWTQREAADVGSREAAVASLFAAYLDRRSDLPILTDPAFHLRLWRAAQAETWLREPSSSVYFPGPFFLYPARPEGFEAVRFVDASADQLREFLSEQTREHRLESRSADRLQIAA